MWLGKWGGGMLMPDTRCGGAGTSTIRPAILGGSGGQGPAEMPGARFS